MDRIRLLEKDIPAWELIGPDTRPYTIDEKTFIEPYGVVVQFAENDSRGYTGELSRNTSFDSRLYTLGAEHMRGQLPFWRDNNGVAEFTMANVFISAPSCTPEPGETLFQQIVVDGENIKPMALTPDEMRLLVKTPLPGTRIFNLDRLKMALAIATELGGLAQKVTPRGPETVPGSHAAARRASADAA